MKSKTLVYLAVIGTGFLLSFFIPMLEMFGVGGSILFMALFLPYFGKIGMLKIHTVIWLFLLLMNFPSLCQEMTLLSETINTLTHLTKENGEVTLSPEPTSNLGFLSSYYLIVPIILVGSFTIRYGSVLFFSHVLRKRLIIRNMTL